MMEVVYPLRFQGCSAWVIWKSKIRNSYKYVVFLRSAIEKMFANSCRANSRVYGVGATYLDEDLVQLKYSKGLAQT